MEESESLWIPTFYSTNSVFFFIVLVKDLAEIAFSQRCERVEFKLSEVPCHADRAFEIKSPISRKPNGDVGCCKIRHRINCLDVSFPAD